MKKIILFIGFGMILLLINGCYKQLPIQVVTEEWENCVSYGNESNLLWNISCQGGCYGALPKTKGSVDTYCSNINFQKVG